MLHPPNTFVKAYVRFFSAPRGPSSRKRRRLESRMTFMIEKMLRGHWGEVRAVYTEGLATGDATFETEAPEWERWDASHLDCCRLVALEGARVARRDGRWRDTVLLERRSSTVGV